MEKVNDVLNYGFQFGKDINFNIKTLLILIVLFIITSFLLRLTKKIAVKRLAEADKLKFNSIFSFARYFIYIIVILITFDNIGINVTAIFAASAALLVGVGLALQTFFQDIISGVFILIDQSVHVGDIIELDGKVGRVSEIKLRTTRAVTIDNKVLIIPNHKYLTNTLYNWTENGKVTREKVIVGVAYGSNLALVEKLLIEAAAKNKHVLKHPEPSVLFTNFADSALTFEIKFSLKNSFEASVPQSEIRFEIDRLFRENDIKIPFPQHEVYVNKVQ